LHILDPVVSFEASVQTLAQLRNEGKIRLVALSNVTQEHIERARKIVPIVSVQNRYSFADREWDYVVDYCEGNEIAFIPWFPLGAGRVAGEALNRIAQAHHASPAQVALAWLLRRSTMMLPIPGTSSIAHLEENVAADQAIAAYDQTVANYRETVLTGFQQVEDNLAALGILVSISSPRRARYVLFPPFRSPRVAPTE
jgi:pyridoxine 4-dehydrogenase